MNEELFAIQGKWEAATVKVQGLDSEVEKVRAQLHVINQELTAKMTNDRVLLMKQSEQVEKVETTLGEIQTTHHAFATVMEKIQNHLMKDGDPDETSSVEETPAISESIPPQAGPSGEIEEPTVFSRTAFEAKLEKQLRRIKEIQLAKIPEGTESIPIGPMVTLTELVISCVRAPPPEEPIYQERTVTPVVPLETVAESSTKPTITVPTTIVGGGHSGHLFTLKSLEAPGNFSGIKHPAATTWLIEMSHWIRLSKVLEDGLWDVVATWVSGVC